MTTESLERRPLAVSLAPWAGVFELSGVIRHRAEVLVAQLKVRRDDVLTAKLFQTVGFYRAIEGKGFPLLPSCIGSLNSALDIFCTLATFDNLARADLAPLRAPAFWVRRGASSRHVSPALPVDMAAALLGIDAANLRASLAPLVKDGAIEFLRSPAGIAAIAVNPGFINENGFRRHCKI